MALDLTNTNKLDQSFSNLVDYVPTLLPQGDRLEDSFGGSARYPAFDEMNNFRNPVVPNYFRAGNEVYESTPYGYYLSDKFASMDANESISSITDEDISSFIDAEIDMSTADGEEYSNFRVLGIGKLSEKQKKRRENIRKKLKDLGNNIKNSKAGTFVGDKLGGGKAVHAVNKFNPVFVTMRGSMLSVLKKNVVGMADAMAIIKEKSPNKRWEEVMQKWWMFGGEKAKFDKAVMKGKGKKPLFKDVIEKFQKKKGFDGEYSNSEGSEKAAKAVLITSALLGVATPILATIPAAQPASIYTGSAAGGFGAMGGIFKGFAKDEGLSDKEISESGVPDKEIENAPVPSNEKELEKVTKDIQKNEDAGVSDDGKGSEKLDDTFLGMPKAIGITVAIVSGLALVVGGIFLVKKLRK